MGEVNKFHALQLFTDTFAAETVHLTNEQVGIYIRLLCFAWTKNTKPFTTQSAYRICQCKDDNCQKKVDDILEEFFQIGEIGKDSWIHKRLVEEHEYLTAKYKKRSEAGKKGVLAKRENALSKMQAPIPNPNPKPNKNIYDEHFEELWIKLEIKRGSKFKAFQEYWKLDKHTGCTIADLFTPEELSNIYNKQQKGIENKFVPHFSTWLSQKRWENEENQVSSDIVDRMKNLGYLHKGREDNYEKFSKDGKNYKIDIYDTDHQLIIEQ